ncbi:MAG TPA: Uma2 family endonuclease [Pirellulales bacterium]|jgi:Uma2 family endonuclease|nr:Uma2 family endonuclease [Pirellulales bacterium]
MSTNLDQTTGLSAFDEWKLFLDEVLYPQGGSPPEGKWPVQGEWSAEEYLAVTDHTNRLVEFTDGFLELLPMPTDRHQAILLYLSIVFERFIKPRGGKVRFSPLRLRIGPRRFREPDLLLLRSAGDPRGENRFWTGADLTLEVVSDDKPERDLDQKRGDYAEAGVPEYWIVDPQTETISVLTLQGDQYAEAGVYRRGDRSPSILLAGFSVDVTAVFDAD